MAILSDVGLDKDSARNDCVGGIPSSEYFDDPLDPNGILEKSRYFYVKLEKRHSFKWSSRPYKFSGSTRFA